MKISKIIKSIFIGVLVVNLYACSNDQKEDFEMNQEESHNLSLSEYMNLMTTHYSGESVLIESNVPMTVASRPELINVSHSEGDNLKDLKISLTNNKTKNKIGTTTKESIYSVFGKDISYSFDQNTKSKELSPTVYIPEIISAHINTSVVKAGTVVTWNVDPSNENGLALWFEYTPFTQTNEQIVNENGEPLVGGIVIPDEGGTYTVTAEDLQIIPDGANVMVYLTRAGYGISSQENIISSLTGVSTVSGEFQVLK